MQKLSGTSSVKNNKSCRIFHPECNKIWYFYDFLHNLQESVRWLYYLSYQFAGRPSKRLSSLQCHPWGAVAGAMAKFWRGRRPWPGGSVHGVVQGCSWPGLGFWSGGRRRSAAAAGASRGGPPSGEGRVRPGWHTVAQAWVGARGATRDADWRGEPAEWWAHRGGPVMARGGPAHREAVVLGCKGATGLYRRCELAG
jgi:hypothetical protein